MHCGFHFKALPVRVLLPGTRAWTLALWSGLALCAVLLAGCTGPTYSSPSWIEAPLVADGELGATGSYAAWNPTLAVNASSSAWLKFSLDSLPSGDIDTVSWDSDTHSSANRQPYALTPAKVLSARLVVLVQSVGRTGHLRLAMADEAAGQDCYVLESERPDCSALTAGSTQARDADDPAATLAVTHAGYYSFDVTGFVKQRVGQGRHLTLVLRPEAGANAADVAIGAKEQTTYVKLFSDQDPIPTSLAPEAKLFITLSDAFGTTSTTDIYSQAPNVRNFRYSASDPAVADTDFVKDPELLLQAPPYTGAGDAAYAYFLSPVTPLQSLKRAQARSAFPDGLGMRQSLVLRTRAPAPPSSQAQPLKWFTSPFGQARTGSQWSPPDPAAQPQGRTALVAGQDHQVALLDSGPIAVRAIADAYNASDDVGPLYAIAATSDTATPVKMEAWGAGQPRYITAVTPRPDPQAPTFIDPDDRTFQRTWCFSAQQNITCSRGVESHSVRARIGQSFPSIGLSPILGYGTLASPTGSIQWTGLLQSDIYRSTPASGPSATLSTPYMFRFMYGRWPVAGYWLDLGRANREVGTYDGFISLPGHNNRFVVHYENLPLPVPLLTGPAQLTLDWPGSAAVTTPLTGPSAYVLAVDDSVAQLDDGTLYWNFSSSNPDDTVPAPRLKQGTGSQAVSFGLRGPGLRTLTVTSNGDDQARHSMDVMVQADTLTALVAESSLTVHGQPMVVTATVQGPLARLTGAVAVFREGVQQGAAVNLDANNQARLSLDLPVGAHSLVARYTGGAAAGLLPSESAVFRVRVDRASSRTALTVASSIAAGTPVTASVRVTAEPPGAFIPTGNVTISAGASQCTAVLVQGAASCVLGPFSSAGHLNLRASYPGDAGFEASEASQAVDVGKAASRTVLTLPGSLTVGNSAEVSAEVSASVSAAASNAQAPGGTVTISGAQASCTATLANGLARCELTPGAAGPAQVFTASYAGDAQFAASSGTREGDVQGLASVLGISSTPNPSRRDEDIVFSIQVTGAPGAAAQHNAVQAQAQALPTGTVTLAENGRLLGSIALDANARARLRVALSALGAHTITVDYSGDARNAPASIQWVQTVAEAAAIPASTPGLLALGSLLLALAAGPALRRMRPVKRAG